MAQAIAQNIMDAADKAVFGLQLSTNKAVRFIQSEVSGVSAETATKAVDAVARPSKRFRSKK